MIILSKSVQGVAQLDKRPNIITRRNAIYLAAGAFFLPTASALAAEPVILVHKDPNCGCCAGWVEHLKAAGFSVTVQETADLGAVRRRLGVPANLTACHTAEVAGYVIEGHVPAAAVRQLLQNRPAALGLAVPGMPVGSPGMEGMTPKEYDVMIFSDSEIKPFLRFKGIEIVG
jgi:hypothetical protein